MPCSTLDPVLRMEQQGVTPQGLAIILAIFAYLFAKPGDIAASSHYGIVYIMPTLDWDQRHKLE